MRLAKHIIDNLIAKLTETVHKKDGSKIVCLACGKRSAQHSFFSQQLCNHCANDIPWIMKHVCEFCGRVQACTDCTERLRANGQVLHKNRSAVQYTPTMKKWLASYKFRGDERWASIFAEMMWLTWQTQMDTPIDIITYVPTSKERAIERSFNQSERLASLLSERSNIPVMPLLCRLQNGDKQSMKSRTERLSIEHAVFGFNSQALGQWKQKSLRVLIIDDVYTTGTTLHACAKCLHEIADIRCYGLTWARS